MWTLFLNYVQRAVASEVVRPYESIHNNRYENTASSTTWNGPTKPIPRRDIKLFLVLVLI